MCLSALGVGGGAMIQVGPELFPHHKLLIFQIGVGTVATALVGLALLFFWPRKKHAPPSSTEGGPRSTFINARGQGSRYKVVDSVTGADTFIDDAGGSDLTVERTIHAPRTPADPAAPKDSLR